MIRRSQVGFERGEKAPREGMSADGLSGRRSAKFERGSELEVWGCGWPISLYFVGNRYNLLRISSFLSLC